MVVPREMPLDSSSGGVCVRGATTHLSRQGTAASDAVDKLQLVWERVRMCDLVVPAGIVVT